MPETFSIHEICRSRSSHVSIRNTQGKLLTKSLKMCVHEFCQAEAPHAQCLQITQDQTTSLANLNKPFAVNFLFLNSDKIEIQMYIIMYHTVEVHLC